MQSVLVPDKNGQAENIMLGFDDLAGYLKHQAHFGCTIGRFGNRIAKGKFTLGGKEYTLATNNGPNHLHGGPGGFDRVLWQGEALPENKVKFTYRSKDGEEGYPGNLDVTVIYTLTDENEISIEYGATTDKLTVVNLTNHAYWNLAGAHGPSTGNVLKHEIQIDADAYLAVDETLIPTGKLVPVANTTMDFIKLRTIGSRFAEQKGTNPNGGYDHCYVVRGSDKDVVGQGSGTMRSAARVKEPVSGRVIEISTTEPGIQFYTGNFLDGGPVNGGFKQHAAFCLETQHFPDSPNQPSFPTTILEPGKTFKSVTVHKLSVEK